MDFNENVGSASGWGLPWHHQHGDFVSSPILGAWMLQPDAEEAALGAHALSCDGVRCHGGVLLPHRWRNNLWCQSWTSKCWCYDWWTWASFAYRVHGQYIMEALASSFLFTMEGSGFITLDRFHAPSLPKLNRFLLLFIGFICVLLNFFHG